MATEGYGPAQREIAKERPTLLLFAAGGGPSDIEQAVARVQWLVALQTVAAAAACGLFERLIVVTGVPWLIEQLRPFPVTIEQDRGEFHFGRRLRELIHRHRILRPLYVGAGSTALLGSDSLADLCLTLTRSERAVIPNNFWSTDFAGFVPGEAVDAIGLPAIDNNLAFLLNREAGLPEIALPRCAATQFDVDTPSDLQILALHPDTAPGVKTYLDSLKLDTSRLEAVMRLLCDEAAELTVSGRVGSAAWLHLEQDSACRIRLFSEERGMRASGRETEGRVRSLVGMYCERYGARGLFDALAELGDGAILDTRVIFAHLRLALPASDRFYSDVLAADRIVHPVVRDLTIAARDARIPVVLGGHSAVAWGLWALIDAAWKRRDG